MRLAVAAVLVAIATMESAFAQTVVSRSNRGDTTVIISQVGRWGAPHDAIEVLRVPESRETTFGSVARIEATPDGGVLIFDSKSLDGPQIRHLDANGKFVRNIGRSGRGPGEFSFNPSFAAHRNGSIYVRNDMTSASVFGPDGKLVSHFALNYGNGSTGEIVPATDGSIYMRGPFSRTSPNPFATVPPMLHYDIKGTLLDTISSSVRWLPEGATGFQAWRLLPDGRRVYTRTDKIGFLIVDAAGKHPLIAEGPGAAVSFLREEREELQAAYDGFREKCERESTAPRRMVPDVKPRARSGGIIDVDGRIWIPKSTTALRIPAKVLSSCFNASGSFKFEVTHEEPPAFAAFLADGTYLGEVRFPLRSRVTFTGDNAWALVPDADDVMTLVKYRLH